MNKVSMIDRCKRYRHDACSYLGHNMGHEFFIATQPVQLYSKTIKTHVSYSQEKLQYQHGNQFFPNQPRNN